MIIFPAKDTHTNSVNSDVNYGSKYNSFWDFPNGVGRCLLGFDISSAPPSADVSSVNLYMFVRKSEREHNTSGEIRRITGAWTEAGATWDNSHDIAMGDTVLDRTFKCRKRDPIWDVQDVVDLYTEAKDAGGTFDVELRTTEEQERGCYSGNRFDSREARVYTDDEPYELQKPYLLIEYEELPALAFADVAVSRRYGDKLYLSGKLANIVDTDEICIKYFRPEDGTVHNLPGNGLDYTYLKGTSGTYTFPDDAYIPIWTSEFVSGHWEGNEYVNACYEDKNLPGLWVLLVYDVSGNCETVGSTRLQEPISILEPRYQYQQVFKTADLDFACAVQMLRDARNAWARVTDKRVEPYAKDCFSVRLRYSSGWDDATALVWLCSAYQARTKAEFMPLPPWTVHEGTEYLEYFRGECNCAEFRAGAKYGIPCVHVMAVYHHFDKKPPACPYIQCP